MNQTLQAQRGTARPALTRFFIGFWTQVLRAIRSVEEMIEDRLLGRPPRTKAIAESIQRSTLPVPTSAPADRHADSMEAPPEASGRTAAAVPFNRFLRSKAGRRYVIASSRATGGFGKYRFAVDDNSEAWALREMVNATHHEVTALRTLGQRFVVHDEVEQTDKYLLVLPLMSGELPDAVSRVREAGARRALGRSMVAQFAEDLAHFHSCNYVHRDVKLAAALWHSDGRIVIAEFGTAKLKDEKQKVTGVCGTSGYMAPEMLFEEAYDEKVDVWALAMAFTALHDNRLQRLFALAPRNPDIIVSFAQWRTELLTKQDWLRTLQPSRGRWDEYFAHLAALDEGMCQLVLERMLEPKARKRADAAEVQRLARRLQPAGTAADRDLLRALDSLAAADAKRDASLATLRAQI